ncbi:MAG: hypothetical protein WCV90_08950 [Candidatus Woesearchaeota archaeon]|jgi:hypothetical protein
MKSRKGWEVIEVYEERNLLMNLLGLVRYRLTIFEYRNGVAYVHKLKSWRQY